MALAATALTATGQSQFEIGAEALLDQAIQFAQQGRLSDAAPLFERAAALAPKDPNVMFNAGFAYYQMGNLPRSLGYFETTLRLMPTFREAHIKAASVLRDLGRQGEVASHLKAAVELEPGNPNAYLYLGDTLNNLKRWDEAVVTYTSAVRLTDAAFFALPTQAKPPKAKRSSKAERTTQKEDMERISALKQGIQDAIEEMDPGYANLLKSQLDTVEDRVRQRKSDRKALKSAEQTALGTGRRAEPALPPAQIRGMAAEAHLRLGDALSNLKSPGEAQRHYGRGALLAPDHGEVLASQWFVQLELSDWSTDLDIMAAKVYRSALGDVHRAAAMAKRGGPPGQPSSLSPYRTLFMDLSAQKALPLVASWATRLAQEGRVAQEAFRAKHPPLIRTPEAVSPGRPSHIGYLSRRFEKYPGTQLMLGLFGSHPSSFTVHIFAHGPDDGSEERQVLRVVTNFTDISAVNLAPPAFEHIRAAGIHILVDYDGMHDFNSVQLLGAVKKSDPAPVVATWLGFAGTTGLGLRQSRDGVIGAAVVDYVFIDATLVEPFEAHAGFTESLVILPSTYQPQDELQGQVARDLGLVRKSRLALANSKLGADATANRPSLPRTTWEAIRSNREERYGIPEGAVVLACLARNNKITPDVFVLWMEVLRQTPGTVLWLQAPHEEKRRQVSTLPEARERLIAEARSFGVDPSRLIFAEQADRTEYFRRLASVDLFLDTAPYGSHTVAADALWTQTPVLTLPGQSFASRVPASLYRASATFTGPAAVSAAAAASVLVARGRKDYADTASALCRLFQDTKVGKRGPLILNELRKLVANGISPSISYLKHAAMEESALSESDRRALFDSTFFAKSISRAYLAIQEVQVSRLSSSQTGALPHLFFA